MTKIDYMGKILNLCTVEQKTLFNRMYPDGCKGSKLDHGIDQIERTLAKANQRADDVRDSLDNNKKEVVALRATNRVMVIEKDEFETRISMLSKKIEQLSNPISVENSDLQERLDLLSALEAGGVDNWEWYDASIENYNNQ